MMSEIVAKKLVYEVQDVSSATTEYPVQNILENKPTDARSRWCSESTYSQFITLKLAAPAILRSVTFGKNENSNVCNVRKLKIYGGLEQSSMVQLCEGSLRNDGTAETLEMRSSIGDRLFPVRVVKIVPLQAWGSTFNYCVWYIELRGTDDEEVVQPCLTTLKKYRQEVALRMCLKMFRELKFDDCFEALQSKMQTPLEHPWITELHDAVVNRGDFGRAEILIDEMVKDGIMDSFVISQPYVPLWHQVFRAARPEPSPCMRGGHQMVIDSKAQLIYMFGGWDGSKDLSDFWKYDIARKEWILISSNTEEQDSRGPSPRSCHKMVMDCDEQVIYVLGRVVDKNVKTTTSLKSDFFLYDLKRDKWAELSRDTYADGGPRLIIKHQVVLDQAQKAIYVCGGQVIEARESENSEGSWMSGLYVFQIQRNTWRRLYPDVKESRWKEALFKPRAGHCMVFHPVKRTLYMFGGHHSDHPINDMIAYDVEKDDYQIIADGDTGDLLPAGLSQRATLDPETNEIFVHSGDKRDYGQQNAVWTFDISTSKWKLCQRKTESSEDSNKHEPSPRYGHQIVYDPVNKTHYLFGGATSRTRGISRKRLDDFWQLQLVKLRPVEMIRRTKCALRKQKFAELCLDDPVAAVTFLQREVAETIDMGSPEEVAQFHKMPSYLFTATCLEASTGQGQRKAEVVSSGRTTLFSTLCDFFPESMVAPRQDLTSLIDP